MDAVTSSLSLDSFFSLLSEDPVTRSVQIGLLCGGVTAVYLLFFTTRDVMIRSESLLVQLFCILLVALLPALGFFLYLLIRPSSTVRERVMESHVRDMRAHWKQFSAQQTLRKAMRRSGVHSPSKVRQADAASVPA